MGYAAEMFNSDESSQTAIQQLLFARYSNFPSRSSSMKTKTLSARMVHWAACLKPLTNPTLPLHAESPSGVDLPSVTLGKSTADGLSTAVAQANGQAAFQNTTPLRPPLEMSRKTADGNSTLTWRISLPENREKLNPVLPFLLDWGELVDPPRSGGRAEKYPGRQAAQGCLLRKVVLKVPPKEEDHPKSSGDLVKEALGGGSLRAEGGDGSSRAGGERTDGLGLLGRFPLRLSKEEEATDTEDFFEVTLSEMDEEEVGGFRIELEIETPTGARVWLGDIED